MNVFISRKENPCVESKISLFGSPRGPLKDLLRILKMVQSIKFRIFLLFGMKPQAIVLLEGAYAWVDPSTNPAEPH